MELTGMSQRRISMKKIREIMRLHEQSKLSQRQISQALGMSRPVISDYITKIKSAGLTFIDIEKMPDETLLNILQGNKTSDNKLHEELQKKFIHFTRELKRVGVTRQILWEEYILENPGGYSYSQFCYHFQVWQNMSEITMHIEHKAGDKLFVDFAGKKLKLTDRITGEIKEVEVFVAILGASQLVYVEASMSQKKEEWIHLNENALRYIGGVPRAIVPDCLKSAVTKTDKYEPDINPEYFDFARHYGTTILPARPAKPKDKSLVEGAVKITYSWIYAKLRDRVFFSLEELNAAIIEMLKAFNSRTMQRPGISRRELFDTTEKDVLRPLPVDRYELKQFKSLTVQFNYHIYLSDDIHYYSVPYRYKGRKVDVFFTERAVEVYSGNVRIASHLRNRRKNGYTTQRNHMPESHKWEDNWDPEKLTNMAKLKGDAVATVVETVLSSRQHPEQSYKTCLGILSLAKKYEESRLNRACELAIYYNNCTYKMINNILSNNMDLVSEEEKVSEFTLPEHDNIRGNQYYMEDLQ
jgi:transposase/biotin operon repressor